MRFNPGSGIAGEMETILYFLNELVETQFHFGEPYERRKWNCNFPGVTVVYWTNEKIFDLVNVTKHGWSSKFKVYQNWEDKQYFIYHK